MRSSSEWNVITTSRAPVAQPPHGASRETDRGPRARGSPRCAAPGTCASPDRSACSPRRGTDAPDDRGQPAGRLDRLLVHARRRSRARSAARSALRRTGRSRRRARAPSSARRRSAAVSPASRSMRMSSGSSRWKLKPRPAASSCIDETPRSASAPSTWRMPRLIEHLVERAVVGVHELDAIGPRRQRRRAPAASACAIAIEADDACRAGFEQRARVAAEPDGAVDEQAAALGLQVAAALPRSARARAPLKCRTPTSARASSSVYGSRCSLRQEAIVVPDVEVVDLAEHVDVAGHRRGLAQADRNEHAPLRVELAGLPEVVRRDRGSAAATDASTASRRASARFRARRASGRCGRTRPSGSSGTAHARTCSRAGSGRRLAP